MKTLASELTLLMRASVIWRDNSSDLILYCKEVQGKLHLSDPVTNPEGAYASIKTCTDLDSITTVESPTIYVEWPSGRHAFYLPESWDTNPPLQGRPYIPYTYDCYTLVKDYYKQTHNIDLPIFNDDMKAIKDSWTSTSFHQNDELKGNWDAVIVPQVGDVIMFSVGIEARDNGSPNHCGIYMGDNNVLHHYMGRTSTIESLSPSWDGWVLNYVRNRNV